MSDRFTVLGLAHVRSAWFTEVARWSTAGSIPVDFVKCLTPEELRTRAASGRAFSAALLDARLPAVDRDLLSLLQDHAIPSLVVAGPDDPRGWDLLGAAAVLAEPVSPAALVDALGAHAHPIDGLAGDAAVDPADHAGTSAWRGRLVVCCGHPGAGTSTIASSLAQGLADDPRYAGDVVLADLARRAHQAVLHDARDVVPGLQELVEAHRTGRLSPEELHHLAFDVPSRGYRLVLGLRRPRDWVTIRARAFDAALEGLRRSARLVVVDGDSDLEGEAETGSFDIEDRNHMARASLGAADLVVLVATPTATGVHALVSQLHDLRAHGVPGGRVLVVVNRAPRTARARAELTRVVAALGGGADRGEPAAGPVYVVERRGVDQLHRDVARFPAALTGPPTRAVRDLLDRLPARASDAMAHEPQRIAPGSLGRWAPDAEATS
ncbi:hypothetical protein KSP35_06240 [Aquihabitans sp. G128]|uniref:hypothetical protein n=1 Tax=Aquihabitans sp. G128 TaxID=2849779 RepID=UPI001C248E14|nr:hypothetical protein [Aquihabitans sp. G128]QXC62396.1 hypothetical protein KSP35_06240 [Aquihabitans sp. G128]